jgi:hypothetical protein
MADNSQDEYNLLKAKLADRNWRLQNLYYILDKYGNKTQFELNFSQKLLLKSMWFLNVILKARQLGLSTFIAIFVLDMCLFNSNTTAGIIDATLPDAKKKLKKIKFAYKHLAEHIPSLATELKTHISIAKDNEQEIVFSNGSTIYADTTFRGDTVQVLHISEYAKICKKDPIKANEIKSGALNAVATGQFVFIESTAEDGQGDFYEKCQRAEAMQISGEKLTPLDYKFHFYPWDQDPDYALDKPASFVFSTVSKEYFSLLEVQGIRLTDNQKFWYVKKKEDQGEDMKREYPATSKEAFEAASEDKYYKRLIIELRGNNQICHFPIEQGVPVDTDWDLGRDDYTSIIFSQVVGKEIRIVDFFESTGEALPFYNAELLKKGYLYGKFYLPHDAANNLLSSEKNVLQQMQDAWGVTKVELVPKLDVDVGINEVRKTLPKCWFRKSTTESGDRTKPLLVEHLENYAKKWNEAMGVYIGPKHDEHSHASDAMRGLAVRYIENTNPYKPKKPQSMLKSRKRY